MGRLRKFFRLSEEERRLVVSSAQTLAIVRLALWTIPYKGVRRVVRVLAHARKKDLRWSRPPMERISWAVSVAAGAVPGCNCLAKALAAEAMLGRYGYPSKLRIGVAKAASGQFEAHAWLESGGRVLIGEFDLGRYRILAGPQATVES